MDQVMLDIEAIRVAQVGEQAAEEAAAQARYIIKYSYTYSVCI
jgi:hypothetical protein